MSIESNNNNNNTASYHNNEPLPPPIITPSKQHIKKLKYKSKIHTSKKFTKINKKFTTKFKKLTRKFGNTRHLTRKFGNTTPKNTIQQITYKRRKNKKPTPYMQNTIKILQLPSYLIPMLHKFTKIEKKQFFKFKQQGSIRGMRIMIIKKYNKLNPDKPHLKHFLPNNLPLPSSIPANAVTKY